MQLVTFLKFYVHHAALKCETATDVERDLACRLNSPPSCTPENAYSVETRLLIL